MDSVTDLKSEYSVSDSSSVTGLVLDEDSESDCYVSEFNSEFFFSDVNSKFRILGLSLVRTRDRITFGIEFGFYVLMCFVQIWKINEIPGGNCFRSNGIH